MYQLFSACAFIHDQNIIHRDIKPENLLLSKNGVLKLCDFGFARSTSVKELAMYTDYVSTRWYRSPELLVGDAQYDLNVDTWSLGCIFTEIFNGMPLFPGESDLDTLSLIMDVLGPQITKKQKLAFITNPLFNGIRLPKVKEGKTLSFHMHKMDPEMIDLLEKTLAFEPKDRQPASELLKHRYFESLGPNIDEEIKALAELDNEENKSVYESNSDENEIFAVAELFEMEEKMRDKNGELTRKL